MYILFKTGPLLIAAPFGTEKVLTCIDISIFISITEITLCGICDEELAWFTDNLILRLVVISFENCLIQKMRYSYWSAQRINFGSPTPYYIIQ